MSTKSKSSISDAEGLNLYQQALDRKEQERQQLEADEQRKKNFCQKLGGNLGRFAAGLMSQFRKPDPAQQSDDKKQPGKGLSPGAQQFADSIRLPK